jgi:hypothetical protein
MAIAGEASFVRFPIFVVSSSLLNFLLQLGIILCPELRSQMATPRRRQKAPTKFRVVLFIRCVAANINYLVVAYDTLSLSHVALPSEDGILDISLPKWSLSDGLDDVFCCDRHPCASLTSPYAISY